MTESCPGAIQGADAMAVPDLNEYGASGIYDNEGDAISSSDTDGYGEVKIERDDLRNPSWMEDKDVLDGSKGFLKMDEIEFWKGNGISVSYLKNVPKNKPQPNSDSY